MPPKVSSSVLSAGCAPQDAARDDETATAAFRPHTVPSHNTPRPWYREAYVWLLLAIPACAFIAGLLTLVLATHGADVELSRP